MIEFRPGANLKALQERAKMLKTIRSFFDQRGVLEVETPLLSAYPALDLHIDPIQIETSESPHYLITSPEYHMKRLLAAGSGSIYQICKTFREGEIGERHNPEFTMIEWYRVGWDHLQLMQEVEDLVTLLLQTKAAKRTTYQKTFQEHLEVDPFQITPEQFFQICQIQQNKPPQFFHHEDVTSDEYLNYLMGMFVEPLLGTEAPEFIYNYPHTQASLAQLNQDCLQTAARFELYFQGIELCNGFFELGDAEEQLTRFQREQKLRAEAQKKDLAIDLRLIEALKAGLPSCAGVAVGFDRLVMLKLQERNLDQTLSFSWHRA